MMDAVFFYITCPSREQAARVARHLLEARLIGCANILAIDSFYWWKGAIEDGAECVLLAKTFADKADAVEAAVRAVHPYDVPCIARLPVALNDDYGQWLAENLA